MGRIVLLMAVAAIVLSACASTVDYMTSDALTRGEEGLEYRYGAFCGPGVPDMPGEPNITPAIGTDGALSTRMQVILSQQPVDDIDATCRAHDMCYELFGHDTQGCDEMMYGLTRLSDVIEREDAIDEPAEVLAAQCVSQADEVGSGVTFYKRRRADADDQFVQNVALAPFLGLLAPIDAAARAAAASMWGFPDSAGQCFYDAHMKNAALRAGAEGVAGAAARSQCRLQACRPTVLAAVTEEMRSQVSTRDIEIMMYGDVQAFARLSPALREAASRRVSDFGQAEAGVAATMLDLMQTWPGTFRSHERVQVPGTGRSDGSFDVVYASDGPSRMTMTRGRRTDANYVQDGRFYVARVGRRGDQVQGTYDIVDAQFDAASGDFSYLIAGVQRLGGLTRYETQFLNWRRSGIDRTVGLLRVQGSDDPFSVFYLAVAVPAERAGDTPPESLNTGFVMGRTYQPLTTSWPLP